MFFEILGEVWGNVSMEANRHEIAGVPIVLRRKAEGQVWTARIKLEGNDRADFGRIERTTGCRDISSAIVVAHKLYYDAQNSPSKTISRRTGTPTFADVASAFLKHQREAANAGLIRLSRYERERTAIERHFVPALGEKPISDINSDDLSAFLAKRKNNDHLGQGYEEIVYARAGKTLSYRKVIGRASDETLRRERSVFSAIMKYASERGYLRSNERPAYPALVSDQERNRRPDFSPDAMVLLQKTSIARILAAKHPIHRRQRLMCHLRMMWIYLSGIRPQEASLIRVGDLEADRDRDGRETIIIDLRKAERLKNPRHRREVVALPELWPIVFRTMFSGCGYGREDFIFADTRRRALGPSNKIFRSLLSDVEKEAESEHMWVIHIDPHSPYYSLRHTFITERLYEGWDVGKVARHCGTSADMIERYYSHVNSRMERTRTREAGPYVVPLPEEIWSAEREDKKAAVYDFDLEFIYPPNDELNFDDLSPLEQKRWIEDGIEDAEKGIYQAK